MDHVGKISVRYRYDYSGIFHHVWQSAVRDSSDVMFDAPSQHQPAPSKQMVDVVVNFEPLPVKIGDRSQIFKRMSTANQDYIS